ncbi:nitroreductase family protein [Streptomyces olivaceoviridis]|uniref:hypothetical protein n=1 Tax=Streptomyces olivaceoviridis TaxID=1921 RepID=UPI0037009C9B
MADGARGRAGRGTGAVGGDPAGRAAAVRVPAAEPGPDPECVDPAVQAPTGGNRQRRHFVIVTDPDRRAALADVWRAGVSAPGASEPLPVRDVRRASVARTGRVHSGAAHLYGHLHEVPALVVPCREEF